ncbi:MAG: glycosyltransferase family 39 protein [Elusimicrobiota bacterium]
MMRAAETWPPRFGPWPVLACVACVLLAVVFGGHIVRAPGLLVDTAGAMFPPFWRMTGAAGASHLERLLLLAWLTALAVGWGGLVLRRVGPELERGCEAWAFRFAAGAGFGAYIFLLAGMAGLLRPGPLFVLLGLGTLGAGYSFWRDFKRAGTPAGASVRMRSPMVWASLLIVFLAAAATLPYALTPETFYDALTYHLELPQLYLLNQRIIPTPRNVFSGVPSVPQMLYGWTLALEPGGSLARLLHWSFLAWVALACAGMCRRLGRPEAGPLAAALLCSAPVVLVESYRTSVGLELALFQFLSLHAFLAAVAEPAGRERDRWLLLCGLCAGLALSSKYTSWIYPAAFWGAFVYLRWDKPAHRLSGRDLIRLSAPALIVLLPWIVKNAVFYGNPVYPFFHGWMAPPDAVQPGLGAMATASREWSRILGSPGGLRELLLSPWDFTVSPSDVGKSIGPAFLGLAPLLVLVRMPARARLLTVLALGCAVPLALIVNHPRFLIQHLAPFCVLYALCLASLPQRWLKNVLLAASLGACAGSWVVYASVHPRKEVWPVLLGRMSVSEFLGHTRHEYPDPPYAAYEYLNRNAPPDAAVLIVGDSRGFHLRRKHWLATVDEPAHIELWADRSPDVAALRGEFDRRGIRYVVVNHGEMARLGRSMRFTPEGRSVADAFMARQTRKVFEAADPRDRGVAVYELR